MTARVNLIQRFTDAFPAWAILLSAAAYLWPNPWLGLSGIIGPLLGLVMLCMGLTLRWKHFQLVLTRPKAVGVGVSLQFLIMPLLAWGIARSLGLGPEIASGLILVGCCPGGTASNVITFLARGDVALSVTLTSVSTVLGVVLTPVLSSLLVGQAMPLPTAKMLQSVALIVLFPVALGVIANTYQGARVNKARPFLPAITVLCIVVIIAIIVGNTRDRLSGVAAVVVVAVALHNLGGLGLGLLSARAFGLNRTERRTVAIEVGMQNSGLAVALAIQFISPLAALPGALFSIWHNLTGSLVAGIWSRTAGDDGRGEKQP